MVGRTLSHYRILEKLGEGGMGVVYKAHDTHLDRPVAIKLLPPAKVADADRKQRFIREAKSASALNHPNIITIHEIHSDGDTDFIVMEHVQGRTLDKLLAAAPLRPPKVLNFAVQIADALASAHAAGIIHRDLKPSNIMVRDDGRVKVLDFGLAKLIEGLYTSPDDSTVPAGLITEEGTLVGTAAYMSPEQAEGRKLDARSDIFSFGAVLYQMTTGRPPFSGESTVSVLAKILNDDPTPPAQIAGSTPPELEKIILRCLRKEPDRRYQTMLDVKNSLLELKEDTEAGRLPQQPAAAVAARNRLPVWGFIALLTTAVVAGAVWWKGRQAETRPDLVVRQLTADAGLTTHPVLSRDGKLAAYASDRATQKNLDIWVHPLTQGAQPLRVTSNEADDQNPDFSPESGLIVFESKRAGGGIYVVPAFGGEERLLVRSAQFPRFSPDGKSIAYCMGCNFLTASKIYLIPSGGGQAQELAKDVPWAANPVFSGDGRHVLFLGASGPNEAASTDWWVTPVAGGSSVKTGAAAVLSKSDIPLRQASVCGLLNGQLWFTALGQIWAVDLSTSDQKVRGPARRLTSGSAVSNARAADASRLIFTNVQRSTHLWKLRLGSNSGRVLGEMEAVSHSGGSQSQPSASADGRLLAYTQIEPSGNHIRLRGPLAGRETTLVSVQGRPKVSPDGSKIAYSVSREGISIIGSEGGESRLLVRSTGELNTQVYGWTPDGKKLVYWTGRPIRFLLLDPDTGESVDLIAHPTYDIHNAELSPDGRWVSFDTPTTRRKAQWIAAVQDGKAAAEKDWILINDGGQRAWWSRDGNLLYMIHARDGFGCIWAQRLDPKTKRPSGAAFAVHHLHGARIKLPLNGLSHFGPAVVPDGIVFGLDNETGNVWLGEYR